MVLIIFVIVVLLVKSSIDLYSERKRLEEDMKVPKRKHFTNILLTNSFLSTLLAGLLLFTLLAVDLIGRLF